jgi:FG-GAP-like repeat
MLPMNHKLRQTIAVLAAGLAVAGPAFAVDAKKPVAPVKASSVAMRATDEAPIAPLMVMGDFNRDGIMDIAEIHPVALGYSGPASLSISLGQANGKYKVITSTWKVGSAPRAIVIGDFNRDGVPDVIVGDEDGTLVLFLGDGAGGMKSVGTIVHLDSVVSIAVADFNHDGILDLAVSDWHASTVTVLAGVGNGSFKKEWSFPLRMPGTSPQLTAADFNRDGITDLAVVYNDDDGYTYDVMLGAGNGTFVAAPNLSVVKDPNAHCAP